MEWAVPALVALAVMAVVVARWPIAAMLGVYALLLPFDSVLAPGKSGGVHVHLTWLVGAAALLIVPATGVLSKRLVRPPKTGLWLLALVVWAAMTSLWALDTQGATFRLPLMVLLLALYFAAVSIRMSDDELQKIITLTIAGGCLAAAISLYAFAHGQSYVAHSLTQLNGTSGAAVESGRATLAMGSRETNPNTLGASLLLPLSLAIGQFLCARRGSRRWLFLAAVALIGLGICATMSRQAILAAVVVCGVYAWRSPHTRRIFAAMAVVAVGAVAAMPHMFFARFSDTASDAGAGRLYIWSIGLRAFRRYAFFGAGLDCFTDAYNQFIAAAGKFVGFARAPHNIYLGVAVELGTVGLLLLLGAIAAHLRLTMGQARARLSRESRAELLPYEAGFAALLFSGLFLDLLWEPYFWFTLMLLVIAVGMQVRKQRPRAVSLAPGQRRYAPLAAVQSAYFR